MGCNVGTDKQRTRGLTLLNHQTRIAPTTTTNKIVRAALVQSTSVTKPAVNDLPFAADGTEIEKVWPFFL